MFAIIADHPVQHFSPLYTELARNRSFDTVVVFGNMKGAEKYYDEGFGREVSWGNRMLESFSHVTLGLEESASFWHAWKRLNAFLNNLGPAAIFIYGYSEAVSRAAILWAKLHRVPVLMNGDSELLHERSMLILAAKKMALPLIFRLCDRFITVGDSNENYYLHYGVPKEKFVRTAFPIDAAIYQEAKMRRNRAREAVRSDLKVSPSALLVLTVGKLIERKGHRDLIEAFKKLVQVVSPKDTYLLVAGDGPEHSRLQELASPVASQIRFLGFVQASELPTLYVACDLYVHPSYSDPHPLAISEAIYCGLPVVVSDRVGSIGPADDVVPGENGWSYPCGDVHALARILIEVVDRPEHLGQAGKMSARLSVKHEPAEIARVVAGAVLQLVTP